MENSIQKIKKDIELKRKHNEEFLKKLKEKSIIYNAQKEKQKKYFQQNNISLLNKKRKLSKNDSINNDNEISNDLNNYTDDDYIEEFMNNSFISNRTFSNLNFCRPERFSYRKKKKKLSIKKEGGFTIYKTEKPIQKLESSNINITLGIKENNNTSIKESENKLGLFANQKQDIFEEKDNNDLFDIKDNKKENESKSGLFSDNSGFKLDNNKNTNSKSLFTSNISEINNKEVNKGVKIEDKKEIDNKINESLFGDLDRKNINPEAKLVFGQSMTPQPDEKIIVSETPKEKEKENINQKGESPKKSPLFNFSTINNKEEGKKEKDNITPVNGLFNLVEKKEENKIENTPSTSEKKYGLFGETLSGKKEKKEEKTEKEEEKKETISLFGIKEKEEEKNEKKDEKKETISLFGIKEKEEKPGLFGVKDKQEKKEETNKENKSSPFDFPIKNEEKIEKTTTSLFNNGTSLFGNQEKKNETNNEKGEQKSTINFRLFNNEKTENINNANDIPLFGMEQKKEEKNKTENIPINNNKEETKNNNNLLSNKGSLASNPLNPFLNPKISTNIPSIFNPPTSSTNNNGNDSITTKTNSLFNSGNNITNNNIFNYNDKKNLFEASNTGGMDMSPQMKSRNLFGNNNNNIPSNNLFNFTTNSTGTNIFGAPLNNVNNSNSFFNNNNSLFGNTGSQNFIWNQNQSNMNSAFSLGVKPNNTNFSLGRKS